MDLRKEQEYIDNFICGLSDQEFVTMLEECGNSIILPTEEIHRHLVEARYYEENIRYAKKSTYQLPRELQGYDEYDTNDTEPKRKVAA